MTTAEYFRANLIVFVALCIGQVVFAIVVTLPGVSQSTSELHDIFQWLVPIGGIAEISLFKYLNRKRFASVSGNLQDKAGEYRAIMITTWASHEGATFFALITYMLTSEPVLLLYALLFFILMLPEAPLRSHFIRKLALTKEEQQIVNDDAAKLIR